MPDERLSKQAETYFNDWAGDYDLAFEGSEKEKNLLQWVINVLFRRKTFKLRHTQLTKILMGLGLEGKKIIDAGCGSGQLSLFAASQGALVTGFDISPQMIAICQAKACQLGLEQRTQFTVRDCVQQEIPQADIVMCIAVLEYYDEIAPFLQKLAGAAGETLIICDTRKIWWVFFLRQVLAVLKRFSIFYHEPAKVRKLVEQHGYRCTQEEAMNGFRTFVFQRS